jgi:hypothetical protein
MATFVETVSRHSTRFQPAFTMITGAWSTTPMDIDSLNFRVQRTTRRGRQVLVPVPADGETEIARFASVARAMATFTPEGKPPTAAEAAASVQRKVCYGAAELMITNMRLCVLLIRGETILGNVNESHGSAFVLSFAYGDVDYVDVARRKSVFGAVKESDVKVVLLAPPAAVVLEPSYRMDPTSDMPTKTSYSAFADTLVEAACDFHLGIVTDEQERARLQQVKAGYRDESGTDLTALIQRRG